MSDMSTLNNDARAAVTDAGRTDAAAVAGNSANAGQVSGKKLPPAEAPERNVKVTEQVADTDRRVARAVTKLNDYVQSFQRDLKFTVDDELGRPIVRVIDSTTQEVIRQIPNDVTLRLARNLNVLEEQRVAEAYGEALGSGSAESARIGLINTRI